MLRGELIGRGLTSGATAPPAERSADEPVLKHGPRSAAHVRGEGTKSCSRN